MLESVWNVMSDIDREPEFWHGTKSIKNISKTENTIEREVVIAFRNSKCREIVRLHNKKSINIEIIEGPIRGRKIITLKTIKNHTTRIDVEGISD
ncbi:MAG: SRPBCC family protein [Candidatus Nitrosopolaris sp.]